jgi:transposase InsO family protein
VIPKYRHVIETLPVTSWAWRMIASRWAAARASSFSVTGPPSYRRARCVHDVRQFQTRSHPFAAALVDIGATHVITRPYRPQTNRKAERFNRTMLDEWAYGRLYRSNASRLAGMTRNNDPEYQVCIPSATHVIVDLSCN